MKLSITLLLLLLTWYQSSAQSWRIITIGDTLFYGMEAEVVVKTNGFTVSGSDTTIAIRPAFLPCHNCQTRFNLTHLHYFEDKAYSYFGKQVLVNANGEVWLIHDSTSLLLLPGSGMGDRWLYDSATGDTATVTGVVTGMVLGQMDSLKSVSTTKGDLLVLSKHHGLIEFKSARYRNESYPLSGIQSRKLGFYLPDFHEMYTFQKGDVYATSSSSYEPPENRSDKYSSRVEIKDVKIFDDSIVLTTDIYYRKFVHYGTLKEYTSGKLENQVHVVKKDYSYKTCGEVIIQGPLYTYQWMRLTGGWNEILRGDGMYLSVKRLMRVQSDIYGLFGGPFNLYSVSVRRTGFGKILDETEGFENYNSYQLTGYERNGQLLWGTIPATSHYLGTGDLADDGVRLYPNPANREISWDLDEIYSCRILDIKGTLINEINSELPLHRAGLESIENGLYLIELTGPHKLFRSRFVKQ